MRFTVERVAAVAIEWALAAEKVQSLKRERRSLKCEEEAYESDTGYRCPACRNQPPTFSITDWCGPCLVRETVHEQIKPAKFEERRIRRRLIYAVQRHLAQQPKPEPGPGDTGGGE